MKKILFLAITFSLFTAISCKKAATPISDYKVTVIQEDWAAAVTTATANNKNICIMLHASWCSKCKNFISNVFTNSVVENSVAGKILIAKIDAEKNADGPTLFKKYNGDSFPTFVIVNKNGDELAKKSGEMTQAEFLAFLQPYYK